MKSKFLGFIVLVFLCGGVALAAILPAGSLDTTFGPDKNGTVRTIIPGKIFAAKGAVLLDDGKIIVAGYTQVPGQDKDFALVRYNPDGTVDTDFGDQGLVIIDMSGHALINNPGHNDEINAIERDGNNIIVAGYATPKMSGRKGVVARFNTEGELDNTFAGKQGIKTFGDGVDQIATAMTVQDGKIIVVGQRTWWDEDIVVSRCNSEGTNCDGYLIALNLGLDGNNKDIPFAVQMQSDKKIVIAGSASNRPMLMRFDSDLSYDGSFGIKNLFRKQDALIVINPSSPALQGEFRSLEIVDGKILAGGYIQSAVMNNRSAFFTVRCGDEDCISFDKDFGKSSGFLTEFFRFDDQGNPISSDRLYSLKVQPDKKIVATGVSYVPGAIDFATLRYNDNGSLDTTFGKDGKIITPLRQNDEALLGQASTVLIQSNDHKVVVVGSTTGLSSTSVSLVRYLGQSLEIPDPAPPTPPDRDPRPDKKSDGSGGCGLSPSTGIYPLWMIFWLVPLAIIEWKRRFSTKSVR